MVGTVATCLVVAIGFVLVCCAAWRASRGGYQPAKRVPDMPVIPPPPPADREG